MKTLLLILLTCFALTAYACIAQLTDQYPAASVTEKICVYNHLGDTVTQVVRAGAPCPGYITVSH